MTGEGQVCAWDVGFSGFPGEVAASQLILTSGSFLFPSLPPPSRSILSFCSTSSGS